MLRSVNPTTGRYLENYAELASSGVRAALRRAERAFPAWRDLPISARGECLERLASLLREEADLHAQTMALEMGKPVREGREEAEDSARVCEYYSDRGKSLLAAKPIETDAVGSWVQFDPMGPVLGVMPWNDPYWQVFRFAAPVLMAGNVALLKHASNVQRCARAIEDLFGRAGFPEGVFQNLPLSSARVAELASHPEVRAFAFAGSEHTGEAVAASAGRALKKIALELGGSDPFLVLDDVRVAQVAQRAASAQTTNAGQSRSSAKRFVVSTSIEKSFTEALQFELEKLRIGDPMDEATDMGPLASGDLLSDLERQVGNAVASGAKVVTGGKRLDRDGFFYPPTLLSHVTPEMAVADEETFGPLAAVVAVADEEEAVRVANACRYGLGASIWCRDPVKGAKLARRLEVGRVSVNGDAQSDPWAPLGLKGSDFAGELGKQEIHEFVNAKSVWVGEPA